MIRISTVYCKQNLWALCSASLAPWLKNLPERMTIDFENDNDIIVYALAMIIDYARTNSHWFLAQGCGWWIASIIGFDKGLIYHINNICICSESFQALVVACDNNNKILPVWWQQIGETASSIEEQKDEILSTSGSKKLGTAEIKLHYQVFRNCKRSLQKSAFDRKKIANSRFKARKPLLQANAKKNHKTHREGI
jgi:hypothetical protein